MNFVEIHVLVRHNKLTYTPQRSGSYHLGSLYHRKFAVDIFFWNIFRWHLLLCTIIYAILHKPTVTATIHNGEYFHWNRPPYFKLSFHYYIVRFVFKCATPHSDAFEPTQLFHCRLLHHCITIVIQKQYTRVKVRNDNYTTINVFCDCRKMLNHFLMQ